MPSSPRPVSKILSAQRIFAVISTLHLQEPGKLWQKKNSLVLIYYMTYFTKRASWAYEDTFVDLRSFLRGSHEGIFVFLCQFSEIFRAFIASFRFSRNFLCATVTHVVSHSFSLIQNRTVDYCARIAHLGRKALHPPTQSIASVNAKLCNRQRKALQSPMQSFA